MLIRTQFSCFEKRFISVYRRGIDARPDRVMISHCDFVWEHPEGCSQGKSQWLSINGSKRHSIKYKGGISVFLQLKGGNVQLSSRTDLVFSI